MHPVLISLFLNAFCMAGVGAAHCRHEFVLKLVMLVTEESLFYWEALIEELQVRLNAVCSTSFHVPPVHAFVVALLAFLTTSLEKKCIYKHTGAILDHVCTQSMYRPEYNAEFEFFVFDIGCKLDEWWRRWALALMWLTGRGMLGACC
jgi:hypothetical protein